LDLVRKDYRSASQFALALRIYLSELEAETEKKRRARDQEESKLNEAIVERKQIAAEKREFEKDVVMLREKKECRAIEVQSLRKDADDLKADMDTLRGMGYTEEIIAKIKQAWVKSGAEALSVLEDQRKALEARSAVQHLAQEEKAVMSRVNALCRKERRTAKKLVSEENRLDRVISEVAVAQRAVNVVEAALRRGYSPDDLVSLFVWLEKMEIQKQPQLSLGGLLELFAEAKSLVNVKRAKAVVERVWS
jgi:chromosome segregation ATPase